MSKTPTFIIFCFVLLSFASCGKGDNEFEEINVIEELSRSWTNSWEEEDNHNPFVQIFRPSDYKEFPPAWFRQVYHFSSDFTCTYWVLASNDAHYMEEGSWRLENSEIIIISNEENQPVAQLKILELSTNLLKVERIN